MLQSCQECLNLKLVPNTKGQNCSCVYKSNVHEVSDPELSSLNHCQLFDAEFDNEYKDDEEK
jgi:hypothetical protein